MTPVVTAPRAQAAPVISTSTVLSAGDVNVSGLSQNPTISPSSISTPVGGSFTMATTVVGTSYFVVGSIPPVLTGSVSIGGSECTQQNPCILDNSSILTFEVKSQGVIAIGGGRLTIGSAPNPNPPTPTPAVPPSAPTSAVATAGNGEVTVSWQAPASSGSFPVTNYQVQSTPGSRGCVVPVTATSCRIGGLTNGRVYSFQVRALNGGGWGSWATTASVTPGPGPNPDASIMITGSRSGNDRVARVRGETTGLVGVSMQSMVRMSDRDEFAAGSTRQVDAQGTFMWQRRINPQANVEVYFTAGELRSNAVTIPGGR